MLIEFTVPVRVVFDAEDDTTVASVWDGRSVEDLVRAVVERNLANVDLEEEIESVLKSDLQTRGRIYIYLRPGA